MSAADYRAGEQLRDGTAVTIRAIHAGDKERVLKAFRGLEQQSVYTRFFSMKRELTAEDLRRLTEVDQKRDVALVGGRYLSEGVTAEIAFTVEEDYQRQGLASRLLRHLTHIARANGVRQFEAYVLPENAAMLGVFRRSGLPTRQERIEGQWRVTLDLSSQT